MMAHNAKLFLGPLLLRSASSLPFPTHFLAPLSVSSLWISSSLLPQIGSAEDSCQSTESTEGACSNDEVPPVSNLDDASTHIDNDGILAEEASGGDPSEKPVWWHYSYGELFDYLNCAAILPGYATLYQEGEYIYKVENHTLDPFQINNLTAMWDQIRIKYKQEVNLSPPGATPKVIVVPSEIGDAGPDKGRGVFVTEFVPKGTLVINTDSDAIAIFKDGHTWRKFVATLPPYTGCNVIEWSWAQEIHPIDKDDVDIRNGLSIFTAWDESNLLNNADWEDSEEEPNVKCGTPPEGWLEHDKNGVHGGEQLPWGPCRYHYYAIKDLEVGEEILMAYGEFEDFHRNWPRLGLPVENGLPEEPAQFEPPKSAPLSVDDVVL
ncbi:hypothetical protein ACHAWX_007106 [Stephanocyclus meneghinianus]